MPYVLEVPGGLWTIELSSRAFNPYLVVRDAAGLLVAEDDEGLGRHNARVLLEVPEGGATHTVWACSLKLGVEIGLQPVDRGFQTGSYRVVLPRDCAVLQIVEWCSELLALKPQQFQIGLESLDGVVDAL